MISATVDVRTTAVSERVVIYDIHPLPKVIMQLGISTHRRLQDVINLDWDGISKYKKRPAHLKYWETVKNDLQLDYPPTDKIKAFN